MADVPEICMGAIQWQATPKMDVAVDKEELRMGMSLSIQSRKEGEEGEEVLTWRGKELEKCD